MIFQKLKEILIKYYTSHEDNTPEDDITVYCGF